MKPKTEWLYIAVDYSRYGSDRQSLVAFCTTLEEAAQYANYVFSVPLNVGSISENDPILWKKEIEDGTYRPRIPVMAQTQRKVQMSVSNYKELKAHVGHVLQCVTYGDTNVAIECEQCCEILLDYDVDYGIPQPNCQFGYTRHQIEQIVGLAKLKDFDYWMRGQTVTWCEGQQYDHQKKAYYPNECAPNPHGTVVYTHDLMRYLDGLPIID